MLFGMVHTISLSAAAIWKGGGTGDWSKHRRRYSDLATLTSKIVTHQTDITDPMSGFFMVKRELFRETVDRLCGKGFKILLDLLSSAKSEVHPIEVPYTFRNRLGGESKLSFFNHSGVCHPAPG